MNKKILLTFVLFFVFQSFFLQAQDDKSELWKTEITNIATYPLLRTGTTYGMQSSYDRTGGNNDGFSGEYSVLRKENGNSVIAELKGSGIITRIWFPFDASFPDAPMFLRDKRIFIYLDGSTTPAINIPVIELFNNSNTQFPFPLCGMALGGCWCHVPIPFNKGLKIVVEGDRAAFFHVQYNKYDKDINIETFSSDRNPLVTYRDSIMEVLWNSGDIDYLEIPDPVSNHSTLALKPGENKLSFPAGPAVLRALIVKGAPEDLCSFLGGTLKITWDDANVPAIDVPLSMFFIQENGGLSGKSLLAGRLTDGNGVYNFLPMPYRYHANVILVIPQKCEVEITTVFEMPDTFPQGSCYLHSNYNKEHPTSPGKKYEWLNVLGTGHYIGVYMRAEGESLTNTGSKSTLGEIYWTGCLEGDEVFEVDGEIVQHGTGTEDYFNAGWNGMFGRLDHAQTFPFHGYTLYNAGKITSGTAAYRWHLPTEVIPFNKQIRGTIEVGPVDDYQGNYESVAYFYLKQK